LPLKIEIFRWQLYQDVVLTKENMRKRKWMGSPKYSLCGRGRVTPLPGTNRAATRPSPAAARPSSVAARAPPPTALPRRPCRRQGELAPPPGHLPPPPGHPPVAARTPARSPPGGSPHERTRLLFSFFLKVPYVKKLALFVKLALIELLCIL
jgi:hypothetical protein